MSVNALLPLPSPPGPWVDSEACACGERYRDYHPGVTWDAGVDRVRRAAEDAGGGFRSRGPVLWAMRVIKHEEWFMRHAGCKPKVPCPSCEDLCPWCE